MPERKRPAAKPAEPVVPDLPDDGLARVAETMLGSVARRINLRDSVPAAALVDQHVQTRVLQTYCAALEGLNGTAALTWLLHRLVQLETRLLVLQSGGAIPPIATENDSSGLSLESLSQDAPERHAVTLDCDDTLVQSGFYGPESTMSGGHYRWIGPSPRASVFLPKLRPPLSVVLTVHAAFLPELLPDIRVSLDGGAWTGMTATGSDFPQRLEAVIPRGGDHQVLTMRLDIDVVRTESPAARGGPDRRELGIALSRIEISSL